MPKKEEEFQKLDTRLEEPFTVEWDGYNIELEDNCMVVDLVFIEKNGAKVCIAFDKHDAKRLIKQLKKIVKVLLS